MEEEEAAVDGGACRLPPPVAGDFTPAAAGDPSRSASAPRCCLPTSSSSATHTSSDTASPPPPRSPSASAAARPSPAATSAQATPRPTLPLPLRHAKEMVRASRGLLGGFAVQVSPGFDASVDGGSIFDDELVLSKEPFGGCVSTVEAVARALRSVEPNGAEVEDRLLGVLRTMVRMQAGYQKPMKPRPRLEKKGKKKKREEEEEGNAGTSEC